MIRGKRWVCLLNMNMKRKGNWTVGKLGRMKTRRWMGKQGWEDRGLGSRLIKGRRSLVEISRLRILRI